MNREILDKIWSIPDYGFDNPKMLENGEEIRKALFKKQKEKAKRRRIMKRTQVVYFIQAGEFGIKIGYTYNLTRRLAALRLMCPIPIVVLHTFKGTFEKEKQLHRKFAHLRLHDEWFKCSPEIFDYISKIV